MQQEQKIYGQMEKLQSNLLKKINYILKKHLFLMDYSNLFHLILLLVLEVKGIY